MGGQPDELGAAAGAGVDTAGAEGGTETQTAAEDGEGAGAEMARGIAGGERGVRFAWPVAVTVDTRGDMRRDAESGGIVVGVFGLRYDRDSISR